MLAVSHRSFEALSTSHAGLAMEDLGTINPAALNAPASTISPNLLSTSSPRGQKRSRTPDSYNTPGVKTEGDDAKTNKIRKLKAEQSPATSNMSVAIGHQPVQTPHMRTTSLSHASPTQASPTRSTPGSVSKPPVIKALPTVRDHTTDQLGPQGDEYIPREIDDSGETKVSQDGYPLGERKYRCRTFNVPNRGEKLFMLATECARVLGYRDSYLLFNKNRSLYKIIANQAEKDNLIHQEILPYSYRSRQIAIVTARSMFRQFGSRLIEGGRRVRDDYWEAKARKQGFTEDDPAGEKRPGAARARELAAAEAAANHANALNSLPQHGEIIYNNAGMDGGPPGLGQVSLAPLPMIHLPSEDLRPSVTGGLLRPRQEVTGPAYMDATRSSAPAEIMTQAVGAADFNKQLAAQREHRRGYLQTYWERPHEQQTTEAQTEQAGSSTVAPQNLQSPQNVSQQRQEAPQAYSTYQNPQNAMPSPVQTMHRGGPGPIHHGSPSMAAGAQHRQTPSYSVYPQTQMWPPPQPQPSPLGQSHMSGYGQSQPQQQQHHSQMPPPQMPGQAMSYAQQLGQMNSAYSGMNRSMYQPNPSQYMGGQAQSGAGPQPGMQGWSAPGNSMPQNYGYQ